MDLQTLEMGNILLAKYRLCENMLEYMSDPDAVTGQKYKEQCGEFFKVFHDEMLVFTHELMTKCGEEFAELHCCEHSEQPETPMPPAEPQEPKFPIGSKVEIVGGKFDGCIGLVMNYEPAVDGMVYYVKSDFNDNGTLFSMWFAESNLEAYVEESEEKPEEPTLKFKEGDIVKILSGESEGNLAKVVYCGAFDNSYRVEFLDEDTTGSLWYSESELDPYIEENGGAATPDEGE